MYSDEEEEEEEEEEAEEEFAEVKYWKKNSNMDSQINVQMINQANLKRELKESYDVARFQLSLIGCVLHW